MPPAERRLWARIRNKQLGGFRFRRQHTVGPYIADFACIESQLMVELDGDQHGRDDRLARDRRRDACLEEDGWRVLRFWNEEIYTNIDGVLNTILYEAQMGVALRSLQLDGDRK